MGRFRCAAEPFEGGDDEGVHRDPGEDVLMHQSTIPWTVLLPGDGRRVMAWPSGPASGSMRCGNTCTTMREVPAVDLGTDTHGVTVTAGHAESADKTVQENMWPPHRIAVGAVREPPLLEDA